MQKLMQEYVSLRRSYLIIFFEDLEVVRGKDGRGPWSGYFYVLNPEPASQHLQKNPEFAFCETLREGQGSKQPPIPTHALVVLFAPPLFMFDDVLFRASF